MAEKKNKAIKDGAVEKVLDRIVIACGTGSAVFLLILMLLVFTDVFRRYFFHKPILGGVELVEFLMAITISLSLCYGQYLKRHVFVEIFYQKLKGRVKAAVDIFISCLMFFIYIMVSYTALQQALYLQGSGMTSTALLIPAWPFRLVLSIGAFIFCLAIVRDCIGHVKSLIAGPAVKEEDEEPSLEKVDLNF